MQKPIEIAEWYPLWCRANQFLWGDQRLQLAGDLVHYQEREAVQDRSCRHLSGILGSLFKNIEVEASHV